MGIWRRSQEATREQLGAANLPQAHTADAVVNGFDVREDEFPTIGDERPRSFGERMRWRAAPSPAGQYVASPPTFSGQDDGSQPEAHRTLGSPDIRRIANSDDQAGYPGWKRDAAHTSPELTQNIRIDQPMQPQAPWARHRGGHTSDDPTHPAQLASWLFTRPFGQEETERFTAISRLEQSSPLAAYPVTTQDGPAGAYPHPGGTGGAPGFGPTVAAVANTWRSLPRPWDDALVVTGQGEAPAQMSARRANNWRLR